MKAIQMKDYDLRFQNFEDHIKELHKHHQQHGVKKLITCMILEDGTVAYLPSGMSRIESIGLLSMCEHCMGED